MYYFTVYNEPVPQPPMPEGLDESLVVRGLYRYLDAPDGDGPLARILVSGSASPNAVRARDLLRDDWGVRAEVWSAPGWVPLHREGLECDEWNLLHPGEEPRVPWVTEALGGPGESGGAPVVAVSDFQKAVPLLIAPWVPAPYRVLGTDGFGRSDVRPALRRLFRIDAEHIAVAALHELARQGSVEPKSVAEAIARYGLDTEHTTEIP